MRLHRHIGGNGCIRLQHSMPGRTANRTSLCLQGNLCAATGTKSSHTDFNPPISDPFLMNARMPRIRSFWPAGRRYPVQACRTCLPQRDAGRRDFHNEHCNSSPLSVFLLVSTDDLAAVCMEDYVEPYRAKNTLSHDPWALKERDKIRSSQKWGWNIRFHLPPLLSHHRHRALRTRPSRRRRPAYL